MFADEYAVRANIKRIAEEAEKRRRDDVKDVGARKAAAARAVVASGGAHGKVFSRGELGLACEYIDGLGDTDGGITMPELSWAFRRAKRARAHEGMAEAGRKQCLKLIELIKKRT